jgi:MFS family permease
MFGEEESMNRNTGDFILDEEYKRSLKLSIFDGLFFAVMFGMGEHYLGAYAVFMGATAFQLGFFGSLPIFLGSCAQLVSVQLTNKLGSRKKLLVVTSYLRTLVWVPIILSFFMGELKVWILILCTALYYILFYVQYSPWLSWMGDLVDEVARPKYFALRTKLTTVVTFLSIFSAGLILEYISPNNSYYAFLIIFILSFLGSHLSAHFISMKIDVPYAERPEDQYDLSFFSKRLLSNVFGKYTVFNIIFYFGIFIAGPFFIAYQLNVLEFTYLELMIATAITFLARVLFFRSWANLTERHGNINILLVSIILISLIPFGWFFAYSAWHVYVLNFLAGMAWAGFDILNVNLIYDSLSPSQRSRSVSYLTFYKGIAIFVGGMVGSFIMSAFSSYNEFFMVFFVSGIVRLASVIYFKKEIKEIRKVDPISHTKVVVQLFGTLPREGSRMLVMGFKSAKSNFIVMSDQSKRYIERTKKRQHRKKTRQIKTKKN